MLEVCVDQTPAASLMSGFIGFSVACTSEFLYRKGFAFIEIARRATAAQKANDIEKENSRHPIWRRSHRRLPRQVNAGKVRHRNYWRDRYRSGQGGPRPR